MSLNEFNRRFVRLTNHSALLCFFWCSETCTVRALTGHTLCDVKLCLFVYVLSIINVIGVEYIISRVHVIVLEGSCLSKVLFQWFNWALHVPWDALSMPYIYTLGNAQAPTSNLNFRRFYISHIGLVIWLEAVQQYKPNIC